MPRATVRSVSGATLCGPRHVRAGRGNEDALRWQSFSGQPTGLRTIAAVADGHGSDLCPRSDRGSALAVQAAVIAGEEVVRRIPEGDPERAWWLVERTRQVWLAAVDHDLQQHPLSMRQRHLIDAAGGAETDERIAYGCTLLVCAVTETETLVGQIGDGEIVVIDADGSGWFPLGANPQHQAAASDSLCLPGAEERARTARFGADEASLVMLMTDGCTNAYNTPEELLLVGADTIKLERETGLRRANLALEQWLATTAERTEDDATLIAVWM